MFRRLAPKLILSLTIIIVVIDTVFGIVISRVQERHLLETMVLGADQLSRGITSATWHAMLADHRTSAYEVMRTIALKQGIERIRIFNANGRIMFSTIPGERDTQVDKDAESCSLCHASTEPLVKVDVPSRARIFRGPDGRRKLAMITPIYNEPSCSTAACHAHPAETTVLGVLDVALDLEPVEREAAAMRWSVLALTGVHVLVFGVFIVFFTRHFLGKPIRELVSATQAVSRMDLDKPIVIGSSEDLDEVARSFNAMRERLKAAMAEIHEFTHRLEAKVAERTEQLEAAHRKLFQSNRMASLGQLAASVAHEVNNPLSGILNLAMLMQRMINDQGVPPERIAEFRRYLTLIAGETERVGRVVSDLLAFSRWSKPQRSDADLNKLVRSTVSLVSHKLKLMNVEVEVDLDENLPLVPCDGAQLQQVLLNLLLNAAEAMPEGRGGNVRIQTRTEGEGDGRSAVIAVSDTGDGIPPENLGRIFDPFFTTKPEGKGVGLGLAVSYGIIQAHGGEIDVESEVGVGTTFTVRLPLVAPSVAEV
ncbi:MAG TPA: ATP-binding protein [Bryobacteraceae bacterium]|nr:ATP-binding protein [Bryobacteraceae bacterium]